MENFSMLIKSHIKQNTINLNLLKKMTRKQIIKQFKSGNVTIEDYSFFTNPPCIKKDQPQRE